MEIKTANELLDLYGVHLDRSIWTSSEVEIPVIELMKEYAKQFLDLAIEEGKNLGKELNNDFELDLGTILKIKEQLK